MIMKVACLFLVLGLAAQSASALPKYTLKNFEKYTVSGILSLPYAEIEEPFRAWYDITKGASRIDYYDGMVSTFQFSPKHSNKDMKKNYGFGVKINPYTTEKVYNAKGCFFANGTEEMPFGLQSVIPESTGFAFIKETTYKAYSVEMWIKEIQEGDKKNTYTFYIDIKTGFPVYYEMMGYDSLLGSHYDKYFIEYFNWDKQKEIDESVFDFDKLTTFGKDKKKWDNKDYTCTDYQGADYQKHFALANPMQEFIQHNSWDDSHFHSTFHKWTKEHEKKYESDMEHKQRKMFFKHNYRFIQSWNRKGKSYTLAVNHLADKSDEEFKVLTGRMTTKTNQTNNGKYFNSKKFKSSKLPENFDWRIFGAVTPVKDQGVCGSCWSFGTVGALEGAYFLKHKELVKFSEQSLVDCSWGFGNNGCDGGLDFQAYDWIKKHGGIPTSESYGSYKSVDGFCHYDEAKVGAKITEYYNVAENKPYELKTALVNNGPLSIAIDAGHKSMIFYSNGVYYEPECGKKEDQLDHAVLLVGYGKAYDQNYWLVKNSWSTYWGNDGYILMSAKDNNCGVATAATFPKVE